MSDVTAGQITFLAGETPVAAAVAGTVELADEVLVDTELSDRDLLANALSEALTAKRRGHVLGGMDDVALTRAERRARRATARVVLRTQVVAA